MITLSSPVKPLSIRLRSVVKITSVLASASAVSSLAFIVIFFVVTAVPQTRSSGRLPVPDLCLLAMVRPAW